MSRATSGRIGVQIIRSRAGAGTCRGLTGAVSGLATRSGMGGEAVQVEGDGVGGA
jgi:hypothetical protein